MRNTVEMRRLLDKLAIEEAMEESVGERWEQNIKMIEARQNARHRLDKLMRGKDMDELNFYGKRRA